jgi:hypothetical protein
MISTPRRLTKFARFAVLTLIAAGLAAASCTLVGQGDLHVANDLSGLGRDNTTFKAYAPEPGDPWPPMDSVNIAVQGDDFGHPPTYAMNGYVYLVRTDQVCPQSEAAPETFRLSDVAIAGVVSVINGSVNQFVTIADSAAARQSHWALIDVGEMTGYPGEHFIYRCGVVQWSPFVGVLVNPCTLRTSLQGTPLAVGKSFALNPNTKWQFCNGGAAAGSSEKFLFHTTNGGAAWTLISRTTLGSPPPETGVGELPNGNGVTVLYFQDATNGWLGLSSPGHNLLRSTDGGVNWAEVVVTDLDPGVPVDTISFTDATHGTFTAPTGTWTTSDGGTTWTKSP